MDNENNKNRRAEFYSDIPREVVELLMNEDNENSGINEEKVNRNNIEDGQTHVHNLKHRERSASFMDFVDDTNVDLGDEAENVRSAKAAVAKSKAELNELVSEKKQAVKSRKKDYTDIKQDPDRIHKSAELENMFGDSSRRRRRGGSGAGIIIALIVFAGLTVFFGYQYILNRMDTSKSETIAAETEALRAQYEALKLENLALQEEIGVLRGDIVLPETSETPAETEAPPQAEAPAEAPQSRTYTVVSGDTFWKIAQNFYGNGAEYQKILDANNLTENSPINAGDTLIIPN